MQSSALRRYRPVTAVAVLLLGCSSAAAADREDLARLLDEFLAGADQLAAHERIWADDLVYTSSSGTRTGKAAILEGLRAAAPDGSESATVYSAEDVDIRLYGDTAVVAFRLVATPGLDGADVTRFFNTGTFVKRDGEWRAVAWQATRIPAQPSGDGG